MDTESSSSISSPPRKNSRGKIVRSGQRKNVVNLYKSLQQKNPSLKYKDMIKYLSKETGIGQVTISRTLAEYKQTGTVLSPKKTRVRQKLSEGLTEEQRAIIRKKVHEFWFRHELPTLDKVLHVVREEPELPTLSRTTLYHVLRKLQFRYAKRRRKCALIDRDKIVLWRQNYVQKIQPYKCEGRPIYYIDKTWLNTGECRKRIRSDESVLPCKDARGWKLSTDTVDSSRIGECLFILHIGSKDGFLPGGLLFLPSKKQSTDYHDEMNSEMFFRWFRNILPTLEENAVIVMDNAPYNSAKVETYPNMNWKKEKIIEWLIRKEQVVQPDYVKAQLMEIVQQVKPAHTKYVIDEYAAQHNMTVLRLPPYHSDLNPIKLAWAMVKKNFRNDDTTNRLPRVKELLQEAMDKISVENWKRFIERTTQQEELYKQLDVIIDDILDEFTDPAEISSESDEEVSSEALSDDVPWNLE